MEASGMIDLVGTLAGELGVAPAQVAGALRLLEQENTIPFIARYRKEQTGSMDEVVLRDLRDRSQYLGELEERRRSVLESIETQGKLSPELRAQIEAVSTKQALEDLYLPFRPKRRTRATIAREKGLEPLAHALFLERLPDAEADAAVSAFCAGVEGGMSAEDAWAGCRDILAEQAAEHAESRAWTRGSTWAKGLIRSTPTAEYAERRTKYADYYAFEEPLARIPAHRYLALRRGEMEKVLRVTVAAPEEEILAHLSGHWCSGVQGRLGEQWRQVLEDGYRRLIAPSIEVELRVQLKESADAASIAMFAENLRSLLLQPPGGQRVLLGLDPGLRTGSKWAAVDGTGRLLEHGTIFPLQPQNQVGQSAQVIEGVVRRHGVEVIAVGNGTASRELLAFVRQTLQAAGLTARPVLVNEAGASVYSASDLAREEFPELDVTIRGAISIARRWQDPLSELVKIDPRSIGVGQYQHDVNQSRLRQALDDTVEFCVNRVGVNLNTASWALLRYVSGLGAAQAKEIVLFRDARGPFASREALQRVPRLGPKAFQQCAGFLRIPDAANPLDASAVHPEHYALVQRMAADLGVALSELVRNEALLDRIDLQRYVTDETGMPTLQDILGELRKPGRDPREPADAVQFNEAVTELAHLRPGMQLQGVVTNVTHFGAFVDIGVHQDGLVHISQLADRFVRSPGEVVQVGQAVRVTVLSLDEERKRIALSMKSQPDLSGGRPAPRAKAEAGRAATQRSGASRAGERRPERSRGGARAGRSAAAGKPAHPQQQAPTREAAAPRREPSGPPAALDDVLRKFGSPPKR
jgi:uncharacterized protein